MKINKNELIFIPIGGSEEIGMNANLYHFNGKWILIDLGIAFPDENLMGIDILLPDYDFIRSLGDDLLGIFLTHAHEDHYGAVTYFANQISCPVWGTEFTMALLRRKLKENNSNINFKMKLIPKKNSIKVGYFEIVPIRASHSIPQPLSFLIKTNLGNVFHTGDWKTEPAENLNEKSFLSKIKGLTNENVLSIISDSTNSLVNGKTPSEKVVYNGILKIVKKRKGCVLITCFSSNISRIKSIITIAEKLEKKVLIIGRSLRRSVDAAIETGILPNNLNFLSFQEIKNKSLKNILIICAGSQGESNSALSKISLEKHEKITLEKGDTVIFSSRKIPGNEIAISKIEDRLIEKGIEVLNDEDHDVHVSGHPSREEIIEMYTLLKPLSVIPVHGNRKQLEGNASIAETCQISNTLIPRNGDVIKITPQGPLKLNQIKTDTKVLDCGEIISIQDERFVLRKHALWNGILTASIVLSDMGEILTVPKLTQSGITEDKRMKNFLLEISLCIEDFIEAAEKSIILDDQLLENEVKKLILKEIKKVFFVRPVINVHVNRLQ